MSSLSNQAEIFNENARRQRRELIQTFVAWMCGVLGGLSFWSAVRDVALGK